MDVSLALRLAALFVVGAFLGSLVNWATYMYAWHARPISPWSPPHTDVPARSWFDRIPILGWFALHREATVHGPCFWLRPLVLEIATGAAVAALYWWEVDQAALVRGQFPGAINVPLIPLHFQFISHVLLLGLMLATSMIDIDEKLVPDELTVSGTVLGLGLATFVPLSLLPNVAQRVAQPVVGVPLLVAVAEGQVANHDGGSMWLEPVTAAAPNSWPATWAEAHYWPAMLLAIACYLLWCFALAPRIWRGRRGPLHALKMIAARIWSEYRRPPLSRLVKFGVPAICILWLFIGPAGRTGLLTALLGLVGAGGIVWAVRIVGYASLRREAMGFGDVLLMMMIGTFLGWQACLIIFFLAPFAAVLVGILQLILRRDDEIPYVPYLCMAAAAVVVWWAPTWDWAQLMFVYPGLVISVLFVCLALLGVMLFVWRMIKEALFGRPHHSR